MFVFTSVKDVSPVLTVMDVVCLSLSSPLWSRLKTNNYAKNYTDVCVLW